MFCLRSWLPLLFIPTNASPAFILLFFVCTYFLNRPCVYCSLLLLILFFTSCNWSEHCFFDFGALDWFAPRPLPSSSGGSGSITCTTTALDQLATTPTALAKSVAESFFSSPNATGDAKTHGGAATGYSSAFPQEWTGLGIHWLRMLLGGREWTIQALDLKIQL